MVVILEVGGVKEENVAWLRKKTNTNHINVAELEALMKGVEVEAEEHRSEDGLSNSIDMGLVRTYEGEQDTYKEGYRNACKETIRNSRERNTRVGLIDQDQFCDLGG